MPTRETLTTKPAPATTEEARDTPLAIMITAAGRENLALRLLARQAVPVLRRPEDTSETDRLRLAQAIEDALDRDYDVDSPSFPPTPDVCDCGCGLCDHDAAESGGWDWFDGACDPFADENIGRDAGEEE